MRIAVETHGCRLNQAESDAIAEQLRGAGHELVTSASAAELYVLNSCAITHEADADARAAVRRARRDNPAVEVVVTGCHANAEPEALAAMPEVSAVLGNLEKGREDLAELLGRVFAERGGGPSVDGSFVAVERLDRRRGGPGHLGPRLGPHLGPSKAPARPETWTLAPAVSVPRTRPLLKVQDGCDYQCSFCIVPSVRGRSRSLPASRLCEQLGRLVDAGHPEVVLTGAHLGLWGRDAAPHVSHEGTPSNETSAESAGLAGLVGALRAGAPSARLRLGSVDPHEVEDGLIRWVGEGLDDEGAGLCPHLHLPVQHGDDGILKAMRRAHRVADLERLVPKLRAASPHMAIGTDVILGFPGEDEAAFERTYALFEALAIPFAHVFCWSPRSGTPATSLPGRVAAPVAARRSKALRGLVARTWAGFVDAQLGDTRSAVILRRRARSGELIALTDNYLKLALSGPDAALGRRARVRLTGREGQRLRGELVG